MNCIDEILDRLPGELSAPLRRCRGAYEDQVTEIVLRADRPLCIYCCKKMYCVTEKGFLSGSPNADGLIYTAQKDIDNILLRLCDYSLYAFQQQINSGFITIGSGVRVGLCGCAVLKDGEIVNIRDITSLSFRVPRDILGCSEKLLSQVDPLSGVLICGEPGSGKTTLIRDLARTLSYRCRVSLLDERGELSAYNRGRSAYDMGMCDIFVGYRKGDAAVSAIRSMNPDVIICDELGDRNDVRMITYALRCGVSFIASVHAASMEELRERKMMMSLLRTGAFRYAVFLEGKDRAGTIKEIRELDQESA